MCRNVVSRISTIIHTLSKNSLLNSSVVFGENIDSVVDDGVPVKYIIKKIV